MKTTLELPDELVKEIKLRAVHEGSKLKGAMADLLRKGLKAKPSAKKRATVVKASPAMMKRREEMTRKFLSGEWGVNLAGFEECAEADRKASAARNKLWR
jgi:hypothetical protein